MHYFKIAASHSAKHYFDTDRAIVDAGQTDFTDVAALVVMAEEQDIIKACEATKFNIPIFVVASNPDALKTSDLERYYRVIDAHNNYDRLLTSREVEAAAHEYRVANKSPFFGSVKDYVQQGKIQFDCPGHQGGQYFRKHPIGREYYEFFGENLFRADLCNADVELGDLLIHQGPAVEAEVHAARVYNADKTYFVMNGSTTSNNITITACISPGDLVLFDRNNHKSVYNSALVMSGGLPVYLETNRSPYGFIGGVYDRAFDEKAILEAAAKVSPEKAKQKRPFRLAVIQLGTYDGTIYNAEQVVKRIGHLCDYILFDSAWVGYEQFIPMMRKSSPLLLELGPEDPGIFVVQSTHKQQAGFSMTSQIHKKDGHIKGQKRYVTHKRFNNSYLKFCSTSPLYLMFSALDVNAHMQEGEAGKRLWHDVLITSIKARKRLLQEAKYIHPFVPPTVNGKKWQDGDNEEMANDINYWRFEPDAKWHGYDGYGKDQYYVDPNKFLLTTSGIDASTEEYTDFGIPATILANYLREHGIVPEKNDLNSILFLMTPAETDDKMNNLVANILRFEELVTKDAPLKVVLPHIYAQHKDRYDGYTIKQLCQELHDFYKGHHTKDFQKKMFLKEFLPEQGMTPKDADVELLRNNCKLVPLKDIKGEIALEGALPYPPGIFCVVPGEKWSEVAQTYFMILAEGIDKFPGFAPEIQGVYFEEENGHVAAYGQVYDPNAK